MNRSEFTGLSILIVDDDSLLRKQLAAQLQDLGAEVSGVGTVEAAGRRLGETGFDFVLLDVNLPDGSGLEMLSAKRFPPNTAVIVMTVDGGVQGAVEAMRMGASDYLVKPFEPEELPLVMSRARRARQTARLNEHRRSDGALSGDDFHFGNALLGLESQLKKILAADARMESRLPPVLIQGETGTGKTTIARLLHHHGPRAAQPLVEMNCSALPDTLAESELFGHERGAFTDARNARIGLFEAANGGTLFLDELPSLSPALQAKVLKAIEDHRIRRLGGPREIPVDVRVIGATNRDLKQLVAAGQFREDLYHRLDLYRVSIPPLRERREDIHSLADLLAERVSQRHRLPRKSISTRGRECLHRYSWPGNVRELAHEIERAIVFEESSELHFDHLASTLAGAAGGGTASSWFNASFVFPADGFVLDDALHQLVEHALRQTENNVSAAARLLGVTRDYLRYHLAERKTKEDGR